MIQRGSSSHGAATAHHRHLPATHTAADAASDEQTTKQTSVDEDLRSPDVSDGQDDVTTLPFSSGVVGRTHPVTVTSHGATSPGQHVQSHDDSDQRLLLQPPPPSAFLAPPPPYPFHHLCPSPYVTSFPPPPLYPVRPHPLTPMTHFRVAPLERCVGFQPSGGGGVSGAAFDGVVDARQRLLGGVATSPWPSGMVVDTGRTSSLDVDQVKSSADCRDEVNKHVEDLDNVDCDHIDVDTVDDPTPPSTAAASDCLITSSHGMIRINEKV